METSTKEVKTTKPAAPAASSSKKKRGKRTVTNGLLCIKATYNNTFVTVTDEAGNVLTSASAGSCGFRGSRKSTPYAAQVASEKALTAAAQTFNMKSVAAKVSGVGMGRESSLRGAVASGVEISSISDMTSLRFGGCRARKPPRN